MHQVLILIYYYLLTITDLSSFFSLDITITLDYLFRINKVQQLIECGFIPGVTFCVLKNI